MLKLPKVEKSLSKGLTRREKAKHLVVGIFLSASVAISALSLNDASANVPGASQPTLEGATPALLLIPAVTDTLQVAGHYSHSSHGSHGSHTSHYSSRY